MAIFADLPAVRYAVSAVLIAVALALQFVPLFHRRINPLVARYPALKLVNSRLFQLIVGFGLLSVGIDLLNIA